jgi:hypothetical protein
MSKYSDFFLLSNAEYVNIGERLRLRRYGSWLTEEAWCREEQNKKRAQFSLQAIRLARKIAAAKNIAEEEAFEILQNGSTERAEVMQEFTEDINLLMSLTPSGREQLEELVTLFFKNRGEVFTGKKWEQTPDWSNEDTQKLTQVLMLEVEVFMAKEDARTNEEAEEGENEDPK